MMSPQEGPHTAQPSMPAMVEQHYCDPLDASDEVELMNQLIAMPELWNIMNNPNFSSIVSSNLDIPNSTFANTDMNFNQNSSSGFAQDFLHFNDMQFSNLVNANQNLQAEPQDGMVQVKTEEEL